MKKTVLVWILVCGSVMTGEPRVWGQYPSAPLPRAKAMLEKGREAFASSDYETADRLYQQAQRHHQQLSPGDQKDLANLIWQNNIALKQQRKGRAQLQEAAEALNEGMKSKANALLSLASTNQYLSAADKKRLRSLNQQLQKGELSAPMPNGANAGSSAESKDYWALLKEARAALKESKLAQAERLAKQAAEAHTGLLPPWTQPWNDSPTKVLRDVKSARAALQEKENPEPTAKNSGGFIRPFKAVRNLLGWKSNSSPKTQTADNEPGNSQPPVPFPEPKPTESKPSPGGVVSGSMPPRPMHPASATGSKKLDAREALQLARRHFSRGELDEADRWCAQAAADTETVWGLFSDSPSKLRQEIRIERQKQNRRKAAKIMVTARDLFEAGRLQEAKELTYQAEKLYGEYSIWNLGDRPDQLRREIVAAELKRRRIAVPPPPEPGAPPSPIPPAVNNPASPAGIGQANPPRPLSPNPRQSSESLAKAKVVELLNQARQWQQQNRLIEARAKVVEAQQAAIAARKMGIFFEPTEANPEMELLQLSQQCKQQIQDLLEQAPRVAGNAADPARFQKAGGMLQYARQLADVFGLPPMEIDAKMQWLQTQMAQSGVPVPPMAMAQQPQSPPSKVRPEDFQQGKKLIQDAVRELQKGSTLLARHIAEEAMNPKYGVQQQAAQLLRDITLEDIAQRRLTAVRNFLSMRDAYILEKYDHAKSIAATIDVALLPPDKQRSFQEIMSMPKMLGGGMQLTNTNIGSPNEQPGKVTVSDDGPPQPEPGPANAEEGFADDLKQMEQILYDKLRKKANTVQIKARETFKAGQHASALELLKDYHNQLAMAKLAPAKIAALQRPIDQRIRQYKILMAQLEWEQALKAAQKRPYDAEAQRLKNKQQMDQQISELLKEFGQHFHKGDYQKAKFIAEQAVDLDRDNVAANAARQMATMAYNKALFEAEKKDHQKYFIETMNMKFGKPVDTHNPVALNKLALEKSRDRWKKHSRGYRLDNRSDIEKEIERKLDSFQNLNFKEVPLKQAIQDLKYLSGVNIVPDTAALAEASVNIDTPITLDVENIPLRSALNLLLKQVHLTYVIKDNVLQITTKEYAEGKLVSVTYSVGDLVMPVTDSPFKPAPTLSDLLLGYGQNQYYGAPTPYVHNQMLPGGQPVSSYDEPGSQFAGASAHRPQPGMGGFQGGWYKGGRSKKTIEDQLMKLITSTIAPNTWSEVGGKGTIQYFPTGMGIVVNQTQDIQEQVQDLLQALRRLQDLEVAIEIRLISVSESFFEFIGMDFDLNITTDQGRFEPEVVAQTFQPFGFANRFLPDGFMSGLTPAGTFTPDLNIPIRSSSLDYVLPQIGGFPGALGADGGLSLGLAFLSDIQVFMFLEAAQGSRRANAMQAPRITVFNGQLATMAVTDTLPFLINIQPTPNVNPLFFAPTQVPLSFGTFISVTPVVSADRRFVRMAVTQTMNNLVSTNVPLIPIQIPVFDQVTGGVQGVEPKIFQVFLQQPATSSITINTTVNVPDGGTVLLGGLKTYTESRNEFGPPVLSKIPYISRLFKNVGYGREATSLMMMITPRIIINEEEELIYLEELPPVPRP